MKKLACFLLLLFPGFGLRLMAQAPPITDYYWYGYTHHDAGDMPFIVLFEPGGKALKVAMADLFLCGE